MLSITGLSKQFRTEVIACYLVNRSHFIAIDCKNPEEMWSGSRTNYSILCVFGCSIYAHVNEEKLELISKKLVLLGYQDGVKGCKV